MNALTLKPLIVSHSSLSTLDSCARKFEFNKLYEAPRGPSSLAAEVGKAIHEGWQEFLVTGDEDAAYFKLLMHYPVEFQDTLFNPTADRSLEACYATLRALIHQVALMEYEIVLVDCIDGVRRPAVELEFEIVFSNVTIAGRPLIYQGFIDACLFSKLTGEYTAVDLKTHRDNKKDMTGKFIHHGQVLPYGLVLNQIVGGDIKGFNVLYATAYVDLLEPRIHPYSFPKSPEDIRDWYTTLCYKIMNLKKWAETGWFPRTQSGCVHWMRDCYFLNICQSRDRDSIEKYMLSKDEEAYVPRERKPWVSLTMEIPDEFL